MNQNFSRRAGQYIQQATGYNIRFYFLCGCCQKKVERIGGDPLLDDTIFFVDGADG